MQINGIAKQLLNPLSLGQANNNGANTSTTSVLNRLKDAAGSPGGAAFHEILARYDVTAISPREIGELAQELHSAGEISDSDLRDLNQIRAELEKDGVDPNEQVDLSKLLEQKLAQRCAERDVLKAQEPKATASDIAAAEKLVAEKNRQLDWVKKFALVQAAGAEGIDAGA